MTPAEKDAMALAAMRDVAAMVREQEFDGTADRLMDARAHLASRIAELEKMLVDYEKDYPPTVRALRESTERATRAEAELAAVRANAITPQHGELGAAIDRAAGELPEGWEIRVCVERGAGWAELYSPGYEQVELPDMDGTLADHIDAAIDAARGGE